MPVSVSSVCSYTNFVGNELISIYVPLHLGALLLSVLEVWGEHSLGDLYCLIPGHRGGPPYLCRSLTYIPDTLDYRDEILSTVCVWEGGQVLSTSILIQIC